MFHHHNTTKRNSKDDVVVVVHPNARSIVFRDHLKRADKTVREVYDEVSLISGGGSDESSSIRRDEDDLSIGSDDLSDDDDQDNQDNSNAFVNTVRGLSKEESVRQFEDFTKTMDQEINTLAHSMVPEWKGNKHIIEGMSQRCLDIQDFYVTQVKPFGPLERTGDSEFGALLLEQSNHDSWTIAEKEVVQMLKEQKACVKTIKNTGSEWSDFLKRFTTPHAKDPRYPSHHDDIAPSANDELFPFTSFVTSTSLLPELGKKMRCYGSLTAYTVGVVFALPTSSGKETEEEACERTKTWAWPAGYAAKTEYNIDHGRLINGRQEALVSLSKLREFNYEYLHKHDHYIGGKVVKGGFQVVPYNEVFLRVGGRSRIVDEKDVATGHDRVDADGSGRSFDKGCGLPVALFVRTNKMKDLIALLRVRARMTHVLGEKHFQGIPLLLISDDLGVRVFTEALQQQFWKMATHELNPFQNPMLTAWTSFDDTREASLAQKVQEFLDLTQGLQQALSSKECARIAGGFGVTDTSLKALFKEAMTYDSKHDGLFRKSHRLQDLVTEGFAYAVRSDDYHIARQLLILYVLVSSSKDSKTLVSNSLLFKDVSLLEAQNEGNSPSLTLPPPLDTKRARSATNSPGLLVVFGAAQILASLKDSSARRRAEESFRAVEEWIEKGKKSVKFRVESWHDQRDAQGDAHLAADNDSLFLAFVSQKAIKNRKEFADQLRKAALDKQYTEVRFLRSMYEILNSMKHPSLRLELLQYILGLDNRYSISQVKRSVELAATCMSLAIT